MKNSELNQSTIEEIRLIHKKVNDLLMQGSNIEVAWKMQELSSELTTASNRIIESINQ